jgi:hypothetical protein
VTAFGTVLTVTMVLAGVGVTFQEMPFVPSGSWHAGI